MMGRLTGVQKRLKSFCPWAFYIHCAAHRMNLVVKNATTENCEIEEYIDKVLPGVYNSIVNASTRSIYCQEQQVKFAEPINNAAKSVAKAQLPLRIVDTRWLSAFNAALRAREIAQSLCATVSHFRDESTELIYLSDTLSQATTERHNCRTRHYNTNARPSEQAALRYAAWTCPPCPPS